MANRLEETTEKVNTANDWLTAIIKFEIFAIVSIILALIILGLISGALGYFI